MIRKYIRFLVDIPTRTRTDEREPSLRTQRDRNSDQNIARARAARTIRTSTRQLSWYSYRMNAERIALVSETTKLPEPKYLTAAGKKILCPQKKLNGKSHT